MQDLDAMSLERAALLADQFRQSMRRLASAVSVVACDHDGEWAGMSATSVTSLSMDPPALLVCINKAAGMMAALAEGKSFSVNVLERGHAEVSTAFGTPTLREQRFRDGNWRATASGVPVMGDALAAIECRIDRLIEYGSHMIVIGLVQAVHMGDGTHPLIYCDGKYQ
ncbi:MAG: flavin reductase [Sphingomonadales bacterium]|nr:flavin reductase [Sphingomonadales bacterium]